MYIMKSKDEILHAFKSYHKMVETKFDRKAKVLCFNNSGEYTSKEFQIYLSDNGMESHTESAYTSEQSGVA